MNYTVKIINRNNIAYISISALVNGKKKSRLYSTETEYCSYKSCDSVDADIQYALRMFFKNVCLFDPFLLKEEIFQYLSYDEQNDYVYFITDGDYIKIGHSNNIKARLSNLQCANARELKIICLFPCESQIQAEKLEDELHNLYSKYHVRQEWFDFIGKINIKTFSDVFGNDATYYSKAARNRFMEMGNKIMFPNSKE